MKITPIAENLVEIEIGNMVLEVAVQTDSRVYVYPKLNCDVRINEEYMSRKAEFRYKATADNSGLKTLKRL
jgi:hypothetical protein